MVGDLPHYRFTMQRFRRARDLSRKNKLFFRFFCRVKTERPGNNPGLSLLVIAHRFGACRCRFSQMGASVDNRAAPNSKLAADRGRRRPRRGRSIRQLPLREAQLCNFVRPKLCSGSAGRAISRRCEGWTYRFRKEETAP